MATTRMNKREFLTEHGLSAITVHFEDSELTHDRWLEINITDGSDIVTYNSPLFDEDDYHKVIFYLTRLKDNIAMTLDEVISSKLKHSLNGDFDNATVEYDNAVSEDVPNPGEGVQGDRVTDGGEAQTA